MTAYHVKKELQKYADPNKAKFLVRFFKCGPGEYGENDKFLGINVPTQRKTARHFKDLDISEIRKLINSEYHEHRLCALFILRLQFDSGDEEKKQQIYNFYLENTSQINNWDLVDSSASYIVGKFLRGKKKDILYGLADSKNLWEQRIAILASGEFIKDNDFVYILNIAKRLIHHPHDLIHKAIGWMLREVGKQNKDALLNYLNTNASIMPRTMLRYSIEKFSKSERQKYLNM